MFLNKYIYPFSLYLYGSSTVITLFQVSLYSDTFCRIWKIFDIWCLDEYPVVDDKSLWKHYPNSLRVITTISDSLSLSIIFLFPVSVYNDTKGLNRRVTIVDS